MGLIENILAARGYVKARQRLPEHLRAVAQAQRWQMPDYSEFYRQGKTYSQSSWVYVCVSRIAEAAARTELNVKRYTVEDEEDIKDHPFEQLLRKPNIKQSQWELMESTFGHLELSGNAYWYLTLASNGTPVEMWPLRPDRVEIVPSDTEWVKGYIYNVDGLRIPLDRNEVVHFKRWHPIEDYIGMSALEAAGLGVEGDLNAQKWNANFFKNNAMPPSVVSIKENIGDADYDALVDQWQGRYKGAEMAHKTAFVRGSEISVQHVGIPQKDMEFLEYRQFTREEIFLIFGIPLGKYSENATEANANVAERTFLNETLYPKLVRVQQKITAEILPRYGDNLVAEFEDVRWTDKEKQLQELQLCALYKIKTIDEIRSEYFGLEPMAEEDKPQVPPQLEQQSDLLEQERQGDQDEAEEDVKADLRRWRDVSLRLLKQGKKPTERPFKSEVIPEDLQATIAYRLALADTSEEVKAIFADPFCWKGYP